MKYLYYTDDDKIKKVPHTQEREDSPGFYTAERDAYKVLRRHLTDRRLMLDGQIDGALA